MYIFIFVYKIVIDDFREIQHYMRIAKEENATRTYAELKKKYTSDIDEIKE